MANAENVQQTLDKAAEADNLQDAIVVAKDENGKIAFFTTVAGKERMIVLLERARDKLVRSLDD